MAFFDLTVDALGLRVVVLASIAFVALPRVDLVCAPLFLADFVFKGRACADFDFTDLSFVDPTLRDFIFGLAAFALIAMSAYSPFRGCLTSRSWFCSSQPAPTPK